MKTVLVPVYYLWNVSETANWDKRLSVMASKRMPAFFFSFFNFKLLSHLERERRRQKEKERQTNRQKANVQFTCRKTRRRESKSPTNQLLACRIFSKLNSLYRKWKKWVQNFPGNQKGRDDRWVISADEFVLLWTKINRLTSKVVLAMLSNVVI